MLSVPPFGRSDRHFNLIAVHCAGRGLLFPAARPAIHNNERAGAHITSRQGRKPLKMIFTFHLQYPNVMFVAISYTAKQKT